MELGQETPKQRLAEVTSNGLLFCSPGLYLGRFSGTLPKTLWFYATSQHEKFPFFMTTLFPGKVAENSELYLITTKQINPTSRLWENENALLVVIGQKRDNVYTGTSLTVVTIGSIDSTKGKGAFAEAKRVQDEALQQLKLETQSNKEISSSRSPQQQQLIDLSLVMVDGLPALVELKSIPNTQYWCVERDANWQHPLAH